jgi:hypothetical protein
VRAVDTSRTWNALVVVFGMLVAVFCVWLMAVWAPSLRVGSQDRVAGVPSVTSPGVPGPSQSTGRTGTAGTTLAVLGDTFSTAGATDAGRTPAWPELVCQEPRCDYDPSFVEPGSGFVARGVGGTRFGQRVDAVIATRPDVVVVAGGAFDTASPQRLLRRRLADVLDRLQAGLPDSKIVVFSPFARAVPVPREIRAAREDLRAEAAADGMDYVDVSEILGRPGDTLLSDDGDPTPDGQAKIADTVGPVVRDNLLQAQGYPGG